MLGLWPHPAPFLPHSLLNNRDFVKGLVKLIEPFVRATDKSTGEAVVSVYWS